MAFAANADVLYRQDFESHSALGWREAGNGTIRFTEYSGNNSLRLSKKKSAMLSISTAGYVDVGVSMQVAAGGLGRRNSCVAELSADAGKNWKTVVAVHDGEDDEVTLYYGRLEGDELDDNPNLRLRFRAIGRSNSYCWGDNVVISGRPAGAVVQQDLTNTFLFSDDPLTGPVDYAAFAETGSPDTGNRQILLSLSAQTAGGMRVVLDQFDYEASGGRELRTFPTASVELVQAGKNLIPVQQGILHTANPSWDLGIQPGTAWHDAEAGITRFALPFALLEKNANCTHNGVLTFAMSDDGKYSRAAFQVVSETCPYFKFDMWGMLDLDVSDTEVVNAEQDVAAFEQHQDAMFPVEPVEMLSVRYPGIDTASFGSVGSMNPDDMSAYGVLVDGVHYRGGCDTRYGPYPFCERLLLPSYSTAKSIFAGLALMRLERILPGAAKLKIGDLVSECNNEQWRDVTIETTLDMASGNYESVIYDEDEASPEHVEFLYAATHAERIQFACSHYPRKATPGSTWVYRTSDTYLAGVAIRAALAQHLHHDADIYQELLVQPIFDVLSVSPMMRDTLRTIDDVRQPLTGWGLTMLADDVLKIADWLNSGNGTINGEMMLDPALYAGAMQRADDDRGLDALAKGTRYNNGFWSHDIRSFINCDKPMPVPLMSGHGGIIVTMFPNDTLYYYFSDGYQFRWREAAVESNKIRSMCE